MPGEDTPIRVLVVSSDEAVLDDARFGFPSHAEVAIASNSKEARRILEDFQPSVVVADLKNGNSGGYAFAREMSQLKALHDVPVLILMDRDQDAWLAREAGAALSRTKPITAESLAADAISLIA